MSEKLHVQPPALSSWNAKLKYILWNIGVAVYDGAIVLFILGLFGFNSVWKIGKDPARKNFRPRNPQKKLKVGIVSEYYYPHLGGLSGDVHYAAVEFAKMGYDVKLITSHVAAPHNLRHSPHGFEILRVGRSIPVIANGSLAKVTLGWRLGKQIKDLIREQEFDVIHIHCQLTPVLPILFQRHADCPIVAHLHTLMRSKPIIYNWLQKTLIRVMNDFEGRIAVSEVCAKPFREWFKCDFKIIPNGIPMDEFRPPIQKIERFNDGRINLFFIGRLEPRNGLSVLIDAFKIIHAAEPRTRLIIAGAGPLKAFFEDSVDPKLRSEIHFIGPILEEKPNYFATADINICPTTRVASLGVTFLESLASGKPTVASDIPAFNETAESGKECLMAHPDKPEEFAAQVIRIIREPALGALIGKRAVQKMERDYDWAEIIRRVDQYTHSVLNYDIQKHARTN